MTTAKPTPAYTPVERVLRYYPQRVQVLVMAVINIVFGGIEEFSEIVVSSDFVGLVNILALALLVFFYGEPRTASKGGIEDGLVDITPEPDGPYDDTI